MNKVNRLEHWTEILNLTDLEVVHHEQSSKDKVHYFTVIPVVNLGVCPHCGKVSGESHQRRTREHIRDLPIGLYRVILKVRVAQFFCERCQRAFTPKLSCLVEEANATERFLERAATMIRNGGDIANTATFFSVPEKTLERWYYDYVERQLQAPSVAPKPIRSLGIDELSLKKSTVST